MRAYDFAEQVGCFGLCHTSEEGGAVQFKCVVPAVLETLPVGRKFYRERECERVGRVVKHGPGGTLVEFEEPKQIVIKGRLVAQTVKRTRVQIARQSRVWVEEAVKRCRGD